MRVLFFYFFDGVNFPIVSADFGVVASDALYGDGPTDCRQVAGNLGYALRYNATPAIHALYFGVFANTNIGVAVGCFGDLCDEPTHGSV